MCSFRGLEKRANSFCVALVALTDVWIKCPKRFFMPGAMLWTVFWRWLRFFVGCTALWNLWRCPLHCRCRLAWNIDSYCTYRFLMSLKSQNLGFVGKFPTCCYLILLCCEVSVPIAKAANLLMQDCFKRGCNLVSCGMRGTFWHSDVCDKVSQMVLRDRRNAFELASGTDFRWL